MRVVSGKYRGKKLESPKDERVRPTTDMVKEAIFNLVQFEVQGAIVLDLFSGSGALGIEAVSRGADYVVFADNSKDSISLVEKNLSGVEYFGKVIKSDFRDAIRMLAMDKKTKFDLIFVDPPYDKDFGEQAIKLIFENNILAMDGAIIYEHPQHTSLRAGDFDGIMIDERRYGKTLVSVLRQSHADAESAGENVGTQAKNVNENEGEQA